jgi:hypothetical protein
VNDNLMSWLQKWFTAQCDGDWEHHYGITIGTVDNPGWYVVINLVGTPLEAAEFEPVEIHRSEEDWVECRLVEAEAEWKWVGDIGGLQYRDAGGPHNLLEIVRIFGEWVLQQENQSSFG